MKTVGIITFHAAHNYGSNLQAYALQNTIEKLGYKCEIINFRTERQKDQYAPLTKRKGIKYILKNGYFLLHYRTRKKKYDRFEAFISKYLQTSEKEYSSLDELKESPPEYDCYISGSDQIWNTVPVDADDAYFLPFVCEGKRIAYAPSFGQLGTADNEEKIKIYLKKYDFLSVREQYAQELVQRMIEKQVPIMPDPTLLLKKDEWEQLIGKRIIEGEYLFFYTLFATKEMIEIVKRISQVSKLPVVISNISNQHEIFSGFKKVTTAGPLEFLSLIKYAKMVCTTSFHGTVFSILLEKSFFVINGMKDNRISTLLENMMLTEHSVSKEDFEEKVKAQCDWDANNVKEKIELQRRKAFIYLKNTIEGKNDE